MAVGLVYNLKPKEAQEERYDVSTGIRRHGNYALDVIGLKIGSCVPSFLSITADLKVKTAKIVMRALVIETADISATKIEVAENPYIKDGMALGTGKNDAVVQSADCTNAGYDEVIPTTTFDVKVNTGDILFEVSATGGTTPKVVASSTLCESHKVTEGISNVALLVRTFEIEPGKLVMPFCAVGKANLLHFQLSE